MPYTPQMHENLVRRAEAAHRALDQLREEFKDLADFAVNLAANGTDANFVDLHGYTVADLKKATIDTSADLERFFTNQQVAAGWRDGWSRPFLATKPATL